MRPAVRGQPEKMRTDADAFAIEVAVHPGGPPLLRGLPWVQGTVREAAFITVNPRIKPHGGGVISGRADSWR